MSGRIFDISELTVHDGDGARVTVFMKGCPLRCEWCHNPEGLSFEKQLTFKRKKCVGCGLCKKECDHEDCKPFGRCLHVCPNNCLGVCGKDYEAKELAEILNGYSEITKLLGGGVTFSGGEPLAQWDFLSQVIDNLRGLNTAAETCGFVSEEVFRRAVEKLDFVIMDIKLFDRDLHKKYTGVYNDLIKSNFRILQNSAKPYLIRTPLIKGKTDGDDNLGKIKDFIGDSAWETIPENKLAKSKYDMLEVK